VNNSKRIVCTRCGVIGWPKTETPGSFLIEVVLWLLFCFPGMIYSVWRLASKRKCCHVCGSAEIVPEYSPRGQQIINSMRPE